MRERGNNRLVILQGPPGCGKSTATRALLERFGQRIVLAEADETWKDSLMAMLGGCLRALGVTVLPANSSERLRVLLEKLRERRVCLVIDESHHLGPRTLNIVKTIINQTPGEIVLSAQGTLFRRLELSAYEEARQLTQNRLAERVNLESVASADVELFLSRRLEWENGEIKQAAQLLGEKAQGRGQFAFAKRVCQQARRLARKEPITLELFTRALAKTEAAR
jgi:type II secretory pathway predicted ATPase ExeA